MNIMSGSIATLTHQFTTLDSVVTPSTVTLVVKLPDGTITYPTATITNIPSATPTATAIVNFQGPAGPYALYWNMQTTDGEIIIEQDDYFAPFTMIHRFIRERLNATSTTILPDAPLDSTLCFVSRLLVQRLNGVLISYAAVPNQDISAFDQALALVTSAYLRPLVPKTYASGELTSIQIGTDKWGFSELANRSKNPVDAIESVWIGQADELILSCSFVNTDDTALINMPQFQLAGTRRYARQQLLVTDSSTPLYQLWGDIATQWAWSRQQSLDYS